MTGEAVCVSGTQRAVAAGVGVRPRTYFSGDGNVKL